MTISWRSLLSALLILATISFYSPQKLAAEDHIVSSQELQNTIESAAQTRQEQIDQIREFFSSDAGAQVLKQAGVTSGKVEKVLPKLSDEEVSQLASKTQAVQANFAAGYHMSDPVTLLLIIFLVVAIVVLIVAVAD